jgi:hypothetical protein
MTIVALGIDRSVYAAGMLSCATCGGKRPLCSDCRIMNGIPWASELGRAEAARLCAEDRLPPSWEAALAVATERLAPILKDPDELACLAQQYAVEIDLMRRNRGAAVAR